MIQKFYQGYIETDAKLKARMFAWKKENETETKIIEFQGWNHEDNSYEMLLTEKQEYKSLTYYLDKMINDQTYFDFEQEKCTFQHLKEAIILASEKVDSDFRYIRISSDKETFNQLQVLKFELITENMSPVSYIGIYLFDPDTGNAKQMVVIENFIPDFREKDN